MAKRTHTQTSSPIQGELKIWMKDKNIYIKAVIVHETNMEITKNNKSERLEFLGTTESSEDEQPAETI